MKHFKRLSLCIGWRGSMGIFCSSMDDFSSLEHLALVSSVSSELHNHLGINDKTLAEFMIAQHEQCLDLSDFTARMDALGADLPQSLVESIDRLINTLQPKAKTKSDGIQNF